MCRSDLNNESDFASASNNYGPTTIRPSLIEKIMDQLQKSLYFKICLYNYSIQFIQYIQFCL